MAEKDKPIDKSGKAGRILRYWQYLNPFSAYIDKNFKELESPPFRTFCTVPGTEIDITPQVMRNSENRPARVPPILTKDEADALPEEKKKRFVESLALSVNDSPQYAIESARQTHRRLIEKGKPHDEIERWKKERGCFVVELNISQRLGLISDFINHHANLLLYDDVDVKDTIIPRCKPIEFNYEEDENE